MARALVLSFYWHVLYFVVGMDLFWMVGSVMRSKCSAAHPQSPPGARGKPLPGSPSPPPPSANVLAYTACVSKANTVTGYLLVVTLAFILYAAARRLQMRLKFGLPALTWRTAASDVAAWLCCTLCVVCQEARTLSYNNVDGGRWHGPQVTLRGRDIAIEFEKAQAAATKGGRLLQRASGYYTLYAGKGGGHAAAGGEGWAAPAGETDGLAPGQVHVQEYDEDETETDGSADGDGGGLQAQPGEDESEEARLLGNPPAGA